MAYWVISSSPPEYLQKFYPSVSKKLLLDRLEKRLEKLTNKTIQNSIFDYVEHFLNAIEEGIPIGPDMGHLLGHLALEDIDSKMSKKFGKQYLRYVDDIIIICKHNREEQTFNDLNIALQKIGLKLNPNKKDILTAEEWINNVPMLDYTKEEITFGSLLSCLTIYLNRTPRSYNILSKTFKDQGFSLPFSRLRSMSQYGRYIIFLNALIRGRHRGFGWWIKSLIMSNRELLEMAVNLRNNMIDTLKSLQVDMSLMNGLKRRWHVQKLRYLTNRLLYLMSPENYGKLLQLIPDIDELQEVRKLLLAFKDDNISELLKLPGRVITTFCELWPATKSSEPKFKLDKVSEVESISLGTLALYQLIDLPQEIIKNAPPKLRGFLNCSAGNLMDDEEIEALSYLDELRTLQLGYKKDNLKEILSTRFNYKEGLSLEGLRLGGSEFSD